LETVSAVLPYRLTHPTLCLSHRQRHFQHPYHLLQRRPWDVPLPAGEDVFHARFEGKQNLKRNPQDRKNVPNVFFSTKPVANPLIFSANHLQPLFFSFNKTHFLYLP